MLPESEIQDLIEELQTINGLIETQESRIEFLRDAGEDVKELLKSQASAKIKRDKFEKALAKQMEIFKRESAKKTAAKTTTAKKV